MLSMNVERAKALLSLRNPNTRKQGRQTGQRAGEVYASKRFHSGAVHDGFHRKFLGEPSTQGPVRARCASPNPEAPSGSSRSSNTATARPELGCRAHSERPSGIRQNACSHGLWPCPTRPSLQDCPVLLCESGYSGVRLERRLHAGRR